MYSIEPIAFVKNIRKGIEDDYWGDVISEIILSDKIPESSLTGIENYSHLEIIYYFHLADPSEINISSSFPRENRKFPLTGIFAQRKRLRPNLLGATIVKLIKADKNSLTVSGLDAINETPVIDIKPVLKEFLPLGETEQPDWSTELMKEYWSVKK
ncbi:MAG TPA: SAM-dependent methyltransferase [Ignavibacteria bacterium]|nr:SAM-dependent methyltransferase [Ignavibacteria bacterium]